jgi:hypothetical protein
VSLLQTGGDFCDGGHITSFTCPRRGGAERGLRRSPRGVTKAALAAAKARGAMRGIAAELEKRKVETPRGGVWHPQLVKRIVERLDSDQAG